MASLIADMREGKLSSAELIDHHLNRIEKLEPQLHAFSELRALAARKEARAADERRASGQPLGLLHGVPLAVKDLCALAGTETRAGGSFSTGFGPQETATVVHKLQDAGAIIIGKTQLTEGAWATYHPDIIAPVNPWAPDRWPGASSSGSGVAVAAGLAAGAIGTDTTGSIRFPSACNGIVGLKPTWGRVSRRGVFPLADTFDHVGPMARTVMDAALIFSAIAGPDPLDSTTLDRAAEDWTSAAGTGSAKGVRIGLDLTYALDGADEVVAAAFHDALEQLRQAGAVVADVRLPPVDEILEPAMGAVFAEAAIAHSQTYPAHKNKYGSTFAALLDYGRGKSALDYAAIAIWRRKFGGELSTIFKTVDMLAIPVLPTPPIAVADVKALESAPPDAVAALLRYTIPFSLAGVPSLTLPMRRPADTAPIGFQLVAPALGEIKLFAVGAAYEREAGLGDDHPEL
jgi:amidase